MNTQFLNLFPSSSAVQSRSYVYELTDHLGNVRAVFTKESATDGDLEGYTDYYPGGMAMPGRNMVGDYRYGYQGQYSEKDDETGLNAFELRMYDSRIGRWISPDPYGQFDSPYIGMGNNPVRYVDPDGGCIKNGEPCNASRVGERTVGDGGAVWEWDGETWGLHDLYAFQLDGFTGTPNGAYTMKNWQADMQDYRAQQFELIKAQHKAEFYAGLAAKSKGALTIIGVGIAPIAAIELGPSLISTKFWAGKAIISTGTQAIINNGNVDVADVVSDAILIPGAAPIARTFVDVRPAVGEYSVFGLNSNKSLLSATIETGAGYFGYGLGARISPAIGSIESNTAQNIVRFMIQKNYALTSRGLNRGMQQKYGQ